MLWDILLFTGGKQVLHNEIFFRLIWAMGSNFHTVFALNHARGTMQEEHKHSREIHNERYEQGFITRQLDFSNAYKLGALLLLHRLLKVCHNLVGRNSNG